MSDKKGGKRLPGDSDIIKNRCAYGHAGAVKILLRKQLNDKV